MVELFINVSKTINHPPVIIIFIGGIYIYVYINHSQSWLLYDIVFPTLMDMKGKWFTLELS